MLLDSFYFVFIGVFFFKNTNEVIVDPFFSEKEAVIKDFRINLLNFFFFNEIG